MLRRRGKPVTPVSEAAPLRFEMRTGFLRRERNHKISESTATGVLSPRLAAAKAKHAPATPVGVADALFAEEQ
jgi:hypothetical protein